MNHRDSLKGLLVGLNFVSYAQIDDGNFPSYSPIYLNEDGSLESTSLSMNGQKCNKLYARVTVLKKFFPKIILSSYFKFWPRERFDIPIDKSSFAKKFELDSLFVSIFESRLERQYELKKSLIPFEMCYKEGFTIPCGLSDKDILRIKEKIGGEGDTLVAVTYQKCMMANDFSLMRYPSSIFACPKMEKNATRCMPLFVKMIMMPTVMTCFLCTDLT